MASPGSCSFMADNWRPDRPFNDLPALPPKVDIETKSVLRKCITARAAVGELKQATKLIPNERMLISLIPVLEARASSAIENIVTTTDKLFKSVGREDTADPATREALHYSKALNAGYLSLAERPLNTRTAEQICSIIKHTEMRVRRVPGTIIGNPLTNEVIYTPSEGEARLRDLLANWERYMHEQTDVDPLIRLAVGHYQFEAIHPFTDGNGRTGRILNSLFMIEQDLLELPILYLSRYINMRRQEYYRLLQGVTSAAEWEPWLLYVLAGIEETASWTVRKLEAIRRLQDTTVDEVRTRERSIYSRELIDLIFTLPYCRIMDLETAGIAKRQTASMYLKKLSEIGVLTETPAGKEKLFLNARLLAVLTSDDEGSESTA
jgi:Fic family protein